MFKKKITVDQFAYSAIQAFHTIYDSNKNKIIDLAQWENKHKLNDDDSARLWDELYCFFLGAALSTQIQVYFENQYTLEEISDRVSGAYVHYLSKDLGLEKQETIDRIDHVLEYLDKWAENIDEDKEVDNIVDILAMSGVAFANTFCKNDQTYDDVMNKKETIDSDKNFAAIKIVKPLLIKKGFIGAMIKQYKITW